MAQTYDSPLASPTRHWPVRFSLWRSLGWAVALLVLTAGAWFFSRTSVADLGSPARMQQAGVYTQWAQGNVIMLIRHAERCDQSSATCLGPADGITINGSQVAQQVGDGVEQMGLSRALLLASPLTRTRQTAEFAFGKPLAQAEWLRSCDNDFAGNALSNKLRHQNLVLVTHSGCIDHFLRALKVQPGERGTEYAEAVLISMDDNNRPHLMGAIKAEQWAQLTTSVEAVQ